MFTDFCLSLINSVVFAIFTAFVLLFGLASYAVEAKTSSAQMAVMSKVDTAKALKNAGIEPSKVALLDSTEMAQTEGEFWNIVVWVILATVAANAPSRSNEHFMPERNGYPFDPTRNIWRQLWGL